MLDTNVYFGENTKENTFRLFFNDYIKGKTFNEKNDEEYIRRSFYSHLGQININFEYTDSIPTTKASKHKFIINLTE